MKTVKFTIKNYDKLFPGGILDTPLGKVKMGEHQFEKLGVKGREDLLWSLKQTLTDPIVIFSSGDAKIYAKSFIETGKTRGVISVVIKKEGKNVSISTHRRDINNIANKIKKGNILYEKNVAKNEDNASAETIPSQASDGGSLKTGGQSPSSIVSPDSRGKSSKKPTESEKEHKGNEWVNPLEEYTLTWPTVGGGTEPVTARIIARTAVNLWNHREQGAFSQDKSEGRKKVYKKAGWPEEAIEKLEDYFLSLTPKEAKKAKAYADSHPLENKAESEEPEESEEEKRRNRSEAMKGNQNARKYGPKPETEADVKAEQAEAKKARVRAGLPPVEKHGRTSTMKDSTWDPKSKDYRYRDTGYIAGSRKELAQSYIKNMAKSGAQVTNDSIDWTGIEENDVAAAEIITKQNLMGKLDWEALQAAGLAGGAGYLINELYKTINSKPEKSTADTRYNFSRGLDAIRSRLEACKTLDEIKAVAGDINGEITGYYVSAIKTPEYLELAKKKEVQNEKIKEYQEKLKKKIYEQGDPFLEADTFLKNEMGIYSGVRNLINQADGSWKGSFYDRRGKNELLKLLRAGNEEYKRRQTAIEERAGVSLDAMKNQLWELDKQMDEAKRKKNEELSLVNDMDKAWGTFGNSFRKAIAVLTQDADMSMHWGTPLDRNETFQKHYNKAMEIAADDFSWSEKKSTGGGGGPRKTQFELKVADHIVRRGGREVKAESTEALKNLFNLRDVQSGNWVLNDTKSAKFHVDNIATGLADLADITGIPDNLVSLNGRLAIAIGARGHSKFLAHYEPVERVINITKMKGGGSLGHEWFHAFDNLIVDAMTGGRYNVFLTENG
ncbi:MAG: hypothetical protein LBG22_06570, partial [Treponema sp.]|nr:hypothetical protein [Treponema sp.]